MNREETTGILAVLRAAYPSFYKDFDRQSLIAIVNLWQGAFADDSYKTVSNAVQALICTRTNTFPPVIGEIKEKIRDLTSKEVLTDTQAWSLVSKATSNGIYGYKKEFEKLPPAVQQAVGSAEQLREWAMMDVETVQSVVASNFIKAYRVCSKRSEEMASLPEGLKNEIIGELSERFKLGEPRRTLIGD